MRRAKNTAALLTVVVAVSILLGASGIACSSNFTPSESSSEPAPSDDSLAMAGSETYAANCAECHGNLGQGHADWQVRNVDGTLNPPPLNGDGHTWHHADGLLYRIVRDGGAIPSQPDFKSGMPAFGDKLSQQEIIEVLRYIKTLWHGKSTTGVSIAELQAQRSVNDPFPAQKG